MVPNARWQQLEVLFLEAVELNAKDRSAFLDDRCNGDRELRAEVESLLHSSESAPEFLEIPILNAVKKVADEPTLAIVPGARIAHYEVVSLLGTGGMGQVYLAVDTQLKRNVALKVLSPQLTQHAQALHRFEHEAQAASALNHPNILTVFEFGEAGGVYFMASELVDGQTLRQRLAAGSIPVPDALDIAAQVAGALAAAHACGITHRDIKPENIVIRADGLVKLLDFGIAKLSERPAGGPPGAADLTEAGMVLGTLKYMSPEQARGVRVDGRTDIFSLGTVLYEMIAGKEPFEGETTSDIIAEILKSDPPPFSPAVAATYPDLQAIISKAMCKDRECRYQSISEFSDDLRNLKREIDFKAHSGKNSGRSRARAATQGSRLEAGTQSSGKTTRWNRFGQAIWQLRIPLVFAVVAMLIVVGIAVSRRPANPAPHTQMHSLAILPFQNLHPDPATDYLGFSLADAVTTKLAYVNSLNVRPSSAVDKYRNRAVDPRKVADELQVDTLLTGSYIEEGDQLRISTQLIDIKANKIIWRDTVDLTFDKLLTVQDRVSQEIVNGLELNLSPAEADHLKPDAAIDAGAYEYYLRGVDFYSLNDFSAAIAMLEKSVATQPDYSPAWAELGRANSTQASLHGGGRDMYRKAQADYERAIALNPSLVEPRIFMGNLLTDTGQVEQAVPILREALRTSPNNAEAHWELGYAYRFGGMLEESIAEGERARGFDPQVKINSSAMNGYLYLGQYDKFLQSLPANNSVYLLFYRGFAEYHQKQWHQAKEDSGSRLCDRSHAASSTGWESSQLCDRRSERAGARACSRN